MSSTADTYALLRNLTSTVVALTSASQGQLNGMILNSAIRWKAIYAANLAAAQEWAAGFAGKISPLVWRDVAS